MSNISFYYLILAGFLLSSCDLPLKNLEDYYPKVETVSAEILDDGSVGLHGRITSEGASSIEHVGFVYDTIVNPDLKKHQEPSGYIQNGSFKALVSGLKPYTKYYFRSFAINDHGYVYGEVISLDSIMAAPVDAPCSPTMNTATLANRASRFRNTARR